MPAHSRQCVLNKAVVPGVKLVLNSWIPEKFARLGMFLKLKNGDKWVDGWKVVQVGDRMLEEEVNKRSQDHKKQRKASDVKKGSHDKF